MRIYKNKPYVKQYDDNGVLLNPFKRSVISPHPNRRQRRKQEREMSSLFNKGKGLNNRKAKKSDGSIKRIAQHFRHVLASLNKHRQTKVRVYGHNIAN